MSLVTQLTAVPKTGGSPDVSDDIVVILVSLPLRPVALRAGRAGGAAPGAARSTDGVDCPVGVRHEVAGHGQVGPESVDVSGPDLLR